MRPSAPVISFAFCIAYLLAAILIGTIASLRGECGNGDLQPSCAMFTFGVALYGALAIGAITALVTLVGFVLRRSIPGLLKIGSLLYALALLSFVLPVRAAGNKLGGAIVVIAFFPLSLLLLVAASSCFVMWVGQITHRRLKPDSHSDRPLLDSAEPHGSE